MLAIGAGLGGLVAAAFGRDAAFVGDAVSFAVSASLLVAIRRPFSEGRSADEPNVWRATVATVRYARDDPRVLSLLAVKGGFGLSGGVLVLLPIFARQVFHHGDIGTGILYGMRGVGALIGPFIGRRLAGTEESGLFRAIGLALFLLAVFYGTFPFVPLLALAGL